MKRSKFNLSHFRNLSCDMGELVPIGLTEVLPGDTVQHATSALIRTQPLLAPVMHPVEVRIHHWYVPIRLIWDEFEDFITGGPAGVSVPAFPTINLNSTFSAIGTLSDYLGVPPVPSGVMAVNALPFRAYQLIWNNWYRDQDLETEAVVRLSSGVDTTTDKNLKRCAWEKDGFTSARPWEQKGPAITVPIGTQAPIKGIGLANPTSVIATPGSVTQSDGSTMGGSAVGTNSNVYFGMDNATTPSGAGNNLNIYADLTNASGVTVTVLREALALQRYEEARARFGSRYVEYLRYLGVKSSDARLNLPEYLGGGSQMISFSEVLQTAAAGTDPVGTMRGHGIGSMRSNRYRRFFEEHGYVLSLLSVRPKTMYVQGLSRLWNRRTKEDFWQRELEHIGQQEVLNKEVYAAHSVPDGIFGYQDRYQEYRRMESGVSGEFRSSLLDYWHLARTFSSDPALNASFVSCVPTERVFPVPSQDVLYVMARHQMVARRMVSGSSKSFIY